MKSVIQYKEESVENAAGRDEQKELKTVSVVIPTHNEEKYIGHCLDSIIENDFPKENLEVFVVDGKSTDKTPEIVNEYIQKHNYIRFVDNPDRFTPFAFNLGVKSSHKEIIIIMGAHSTYSKDYISQCVYYLNEYKADNVGGSMKTFSRNNTLIGKSIAAAISHPFGVGNSTFRIGADKPKWVDTVFGGCYRRDVFERVGYFNEKLLSSQDYDFNIRLRKAGGKILLVPSIVTNYYTRSNLLSFIRNNFRNGVWAILPYKYTKRMLALRHLIPLFFVTGISVMGVLSIIFPVLLYLTLFFALVYGVAALYHSIGIALKMRDIRYVFVMPFLFFSLHLVYGLGSLKAVFEILKGN